jgi:Ca2+-transporting ATPase
MMATVHSRNGKMLYCVKGAPEAVLESCKSIWAQGAQRPLESQEKLQWLANANALGKQGLRNLAFAYKLQDADDKHPYNDLVLLGIAGLADPPHKGIDEDMRACHDAGIRVVMVTGDQLETASAIAREIGLVPYGRSCQCLDARELKSPARAHDLLRAADVIARANPRLKLELIGMYQAAGLVVAMTGDGINDAPALRKADIGVAMGKRGTQVAREAAAMVLEDDEFSTIIRAIAQGRVIYANIRKFVGYLLSCNLSEILIIGLATLIGAAPPLLPLQILFLNLVTDVFPALALGTCGAEPGIMHKPPRPPGEPLITRRHWARIGVHSILITVAVLGGVEIAAHLPGLQEASPLTLAFLILTLSQLWHVFNMRADRDPLFNNEITRNPWIWAAIITCLTILALALGLPSLRSVLALSIPDPKAWILIFFASLFPLLAGPLVMRLLPERQGGDSGPERLRIREGPRMNGTG